MEVREIEYMEKHNTEKLLNQEMLGNAFHMNEALNGMPLDNTIIHNGSHPRYDIKIRGYLDDVPENATPDEAYVALMTIINKVKTAVQNNPATPINQLNF